ncbi:hypothetical protein N7501_007775 [Penicillium viridicatum]|nr:hypothetical protein N7501_007775 [Penicillium viridicatum]
MSPGLDATLSARTPPLATWDSAVATGCTTSNTVGLARLLRSVSNCAAAARLPRMFRKKTHAFEEFTGATLISSGVLHVIT